MARKFVLIGLLLLTLMNNAYAISLFGVSHGRPAASSLKESLPSLKRLSKAVHHYAADTARLEQKLIVEAIGTFFLVLTIGCSVILSSPLAPLAIGSVLMVLIYAGGHISGGHYNPAVTLAVMIRKKLSFQKDVLPYWFAQSLGAILGAVAAVEITGKVGSAKPIAAARIFPAFLSEFFFTFALCYVVLNVAVSPTTKGNSYYGLAIGFTVLAGAVTVGGVSGGAFNPAVAIGCGFSQVPFAFPRCMLSTASPWQGCTNISFMPAFSDGS